MTVGEKIRKFRINQGYTQKELAIMSGLSESAIRNYELGNRFPSSEQLEKIANSLKISPYAMSDPNFDTYVSVMHALFALEDQYGLHAYRDESGVPQLMFKDKGHDLKLSNIGRFYFLQLLFRKIWENLFFYNMLFRQPGIIFDSGFDIIQIKIYEIFKIHIQTQILL